MRGHQKGFDPLSSLFEQPDPELGPPLPDVDEEEPAGQPATPPVDLTDPLFQAPPDLPPPTPEKPVPDRPAPTPAAVSEEQRRAIAVAVGKAAAARARASEPAPRAAPPPAPGPPEPAPPAPPKAESRRPVARHSRIDALVNRARRPVSAAEAMRLAAEEEARAVADQRRKLEAERERARRRGADALSDAVQELLPRVLPGAGPMYVAKAVLAEDRTVLKALWKAHRTRFLKDGELERAVGAAAVLHALGGVPAGRLVAAHVVTDASDYLVWLDMEQAALVAAFADARAYFAG